MKRSYFVILLASFLSLPLTSLSQPQVQKEAQAIVILQRSLAAMEASGLANLQRDQVALMATGTYSHFRGSGATYPFRLKVSGLDQIRRETDFPDGTYISIVRGKAAWAITPSGTRSFSIGSLAGRRMEIVPILVVADLLTNSKASLQYVGLETIDGASIHHISAQVKQLEPTATQGDNHRDYSEKLEFFLDPQSFLPVRIRYSEHPGDLQVSIPFDLVLSNFKRVGGVLMPLTVTRYYRNQKVDEYNLQSVNFAAQIPNSDFSLR